ncbi:LIM-domain binding protein-domain-containing protein [Amanita rubescens]|nr:LIM-domain binding protein-domain-containing protein [Amanita rubescens]
MPFDLPNIQNPPQSAQQSQSHVGHPPAAQSQNPPMAMFTANPQNPPRFGSIQQPPIQQIMRQPTSPSQLGTNLDRRPVPPQPQALNPTPGHITGLPPGNINLTMNPRYPNQPQQRMQPPMGNIPPGPSQTPVNRTRTTPDNAKNNAMFSMGFPSSQFFQGPTTTQVANNAQYSYSPIQNSNIPPSMPGSMINPTGGTPTRAGFQLTPAQQLEQMSAPQDTFVSPSNIQPPRPPYQPNLHPSLQPPFQLRFHQQSSPRQNDPIAAQSQRPSWMPLAPTNPQLVHPSIGSGPVNIAPRLPQQPLAPQGLSGASPSLPATDPSDNNFAVQPRANMVPGLGSGQGIQRLLQFSAILASDSPNKLHRSWWEECIKEYFTPTAIMKIVLWKNNQREEAKPFEIGVPILPRFFQVTTQSGVKSMTMSLDGARELSSTRGPNHCFIECLSAIWTYHYNNGYTVTLKGPMTAHVVVSQSASATTDITASFQSGQRHLKFESLEFEVGQHDKFISVDTLMNLRSSNSTIVQPINGMQLQQDEGSKWEEPRILVERSLIPEEPINAFGIPQATMRCLELGENVGQMSDPIVYSNENNRGPLEALKKFAAQLPTHQIFLPSSQQQAMDRLH